MRPRQAIRGNLRPAILIGGVALLVQLAYLAETRRHDPTWSAPIVDAATYHEQAQRIAAGRPGPPTPFWQPPGYPYFLGVVYKVFGVNIPAAKLVQALLATGSCLLTWWLARRVFGAAAGIAAGLILACYGPMIFFATQLLAVGLAVFLDLAALGLMLYAADKGRWFHWLAFGLVAGAAAVVRPNALVLVVLAIVWGAWNAGKRKRWRNWAIASAWICAAAAAAIAPVTIRNYRVSGQWVLISTNGPINLYIGNNPRADETIAIRPGPAWQRLVSEPLLVGAAPGAPASRYFLAKTWQYIREQPAAFLHGLAGKAWLFVNAREIPRNVDIYVFREYSRLLSALTWRWGTFGFPFGLAGPLAVLGAIVGWRERAHARLLAGFVAAYGASIVLFFVTSRYRLPVVPVLAVFAGWAVVWLHHQLRAGRRRAFLAGMVTVLAAGVVANWPVRAPTDGVNFRAELAYLLGGRAYQAGRYQDAEAAYRRALQIRPDYPEACNGLGLALAGQGKTAEAIRQFQRALHIDPCFADAHNSWGLVLADAGRLDQAIEHYLEALRLNPNEAEFHYNLGLALARKGRIAEAERRFRRATELKPFYVDAHNNLGIALARQGRIRQAVEQYRQALRAAPEYAKAHNNLANALASLGDVDGAIAHYRQAVRLEPGYANAHYNLGTLLKAKGRLQEAIHHYQQVIRLRPGFAEAWLDLAETYAALGRLDEAIRAARQAKRLAETRHDQALADRIGALLAAWTDRHAR